MNENRRATSTRSCLGVALLAATLGILPQSLLAQAPVDKGMSEPLRKARERHAKNVPFDERLIIGEAVTLAEFPWVVALIYAADDDSYRGQFCAGMLLTPQLILTAAHCVDNETPESAIEIGYGATDLRKLLPSSRIKVDKIHILRWWDRSDRSGDVARLTLKKPVTEITTFPSLARSQDYAQAVTQRQPFTVVGWGRRASFNGAKSPELLVYRSMELVSEKTCNAPDAYDGAIKNDTMLCAGVKDVGANTCNGDSGGPLLAHDPTRGFVVYGVISWVGGGECDEPKRYGVFARVSVFSKWILTGKE